MITKEQLNIKKVDNKYRIILKKTYLLFFDIWVELTWKGEEQVEEPIEFESFKEAKEFIFMVTP